MSGMSAAVTNSKSDMLRHCASIRRSRRPVFHRPLLGELAAHDAADERRPQDIPDLIDRRDRTAAALGIDLPAEADVLARLRRVITEEGRDFSLVFTPE